MKENINGTTIQSKGSLQHELNLKNDAHVTCVSHRKQYSPLLAYFESNTLSLESMTQ